MRYLVGSLVALAAAIIITLVVALVPSLDFVYYARDWRDVVETTIALVGGLVAYLALGRFRQRRQLNDLLAVHALGLLAIAQVAFSTVPLLLFGKAADSFSDWVPLFVIAIAACLLCAAAVIPDQTMSAASSVTRWAFPAVLLVIGTGAAWLISSHLPSGAAVRLPQSLSDRVHLGAHPWISAIELLTATLFLLAAVGLANRSRRVRDGFLAWLGIGCVLASAASVNYALFPALDSQLFHMGDVFRLAAYLSWLAGAAREIAAYWAGVTTLAVTEERRRVACDLHDGLAQELALVAMQTKDLLSGGLHPRQMVQLAAAADRALYDSRRAIAALSGGPDEPFAIDLTRATEDVAQQGGLQLQLTVDDEVEVDRSDRELLIRIAREAVANAIRHGHASNVTVEMSRNGFSRFSVHDDGHGFDPEGRDNSNGGFGLVSMRENAEALGASFSIRSGPGSGTTVEVLWH